MPEEVEEMKPLSSDEMAMWKDFQKRVKATAALKKAEKKELIDSLGIESKFDNIVAYLETSDKSSLIGTVDPPEGSDHDSIVLKVSVAIITLTGEQLEKRRKSNGADDEAEED